MIGPSVRAVPLAARDDLTTQLCALAADTAAIFLTHTDPARARARAAQRELSETGGPPVLTDSDATAITLAAALLTAVNRAGPTPAASRVVIAGAATMPQLCPLLMAVGIGDISSWNTEDGHDVPLHLLARHATAVIDPVGATRSTETDTDRHWPTVIRAEGPGYRLLPARGLRRALVRDPETTPDIDVSRACTLALTAATRPDQLVPDLADPNLTEALASAALRVLARRTSPPRTGGARHLRR